MDEYILKLQLHQQQPEDQIEQKDKRTQLDTPLAEYALTKKNICQVANELLKHDITKRVKPKERGSTSLFFRNQLKMTLQIYLTVQHKY